MVCFGVYFYCMATRGLPNIHIPLFFGDAAPLMALTGRVPVWDGIWPSMVGTFLLVVIAALLAIPTGIMAGIYMSEYSSEYFRHTANSAIDLLAGMPSIVMGLFGFTFILFLRKSVAPSANVGLLLASACLAILSLPYMIKTTQLALNNIDEQRRLIGPTLGFSKQQNIFHVLLPASSREILNGVILTIGRSAEDTAVILLTGVVANAGIPSSVTDKFEALPFFIYYAASEHRTLDELDKGFGAALVLLGVAALLFVTSKLIERTVAKARR